MTSHFEGQREANFRERSTNPSMSGIAFGQTFICKRCKQPRNKVGRKQVIKGCGKAGYFCSNCVETSAAISAGKEKPASQAGKPQRVSINQGKL